MAEAGIETAQAFNLSLGTVAIQLSAVFMCAFATNWLGRRTIYLSGLAFTLVCLLVMGILGAVPANPATKWVQSALTILVVVMYGATIGPITYSIVAEISSVRLRAKTVALARAAYYVSTVPSSFSTSCEKCTADISRLLQPEPRRMEHEGQSSVHLGRHGSWRVRPVLLLPP